VHESDPRVHEDDAMRAVRAAHLLIPSGRWGNHLRRGRGFAPLPIEELRPLLSRSAADTARHAAGRATSDHTAASAAAVAA